MRIHVWMQDLAANVPCHHFSTNSGLLADNIIPLLPSPKKESMYKSRGRQQFDGKRNTHCTLAGPLSCFPLSLPSWS